MRISSLSAFVKISANKITLVFLRFFLLFSQIFCTMYSKFATFEKKTLENRKLNKLLFVACSLEVFDVVNSLKNA